MRKNLYSRQVTYVKIKDYVKSFLEVEYDGFPLVIDKGEHPALFRHIRDLVIDNNDMVKIADGRTLNQVAYDYSLNGRPSLKDHAKAFFVGKENLAQYVPVLLPAGIKNGTSEPTPYTQLTLDGSKQFRESVDEIFWESFFEFMEKEQRTNNSTIGAIVETFCSKYNIASHHLDNIERHYRRNLKKFGLMRAEVKRRQKLKVADKVK